MIEKIKETLTDCWLLFQAVLLLIFCYLIFEPLYKLYNYFNKDNN